MLFLFLISGGSWAADALKPFQLVSSAPGDMAAIIAGTKDKLATGGFQVVGEYSPYEGAHVVVATNDGVLVAPLDKAQRVKEVVEQVKARGWDDVL